MTRSTRRSSFYASTDQPIKRVKFIPIKDGDLVEMGATSIPGAAYGGGLGFPEQAMERYPHTFLGFKPGTGPKATGWIVVLVDEAHLTSQPAKRYQRKRLKVAS
jgi:hypothetical protein